LQKKRRAVRVRGTAKKERKAEKRGGGKNSNVKEMGEIEEGTTDCAGGNIIGGGLEALARAGAVVRKEREAEKGSMSSIAQ